MGILEGKVAIITGAGAGLGLGIGRAFAKEGAIVATIGRRADKIAAAAAEFKSIAGKAFGMQGDVGKRDDVNKFVAAVVKEFGTVDILVNNAMAYNAKKIIDTTDEDVEKVMRSAVYGTLYCMQACFPYLKEHGGKVINFSSVAALYGAVDHGSYAIAKEGLSGFTKVAALEWAQYNIQVNAIAPLGESETSAAYAKLDPEEHVKHMKAIPMGRMGDPEKDIGRACVMLASSYADFITARTIFVDGGMGAIR